MPLSYSLKPFHHAIDQSFCQTVCQTINFGLTHFIKRFHMTRTDAPPAPMGTNPDNAASPCVSIEDWDALFAAVTTRLGQIAQAHDAPAVDSGSAQALALLRSSVLESVQDLDQLRTMARQMLDKRAEE